MREGILDAELLFGKASARDAVYSERTNVRQARGWDPEHFARQQIRSLVRKVFFSNAERPVRQVVFNALEPETDVRDICLRVGEELALESGASIALVFQDAGNSPAETKTTAADASEPLRQVASRLRGNLWQLPNAGQILGASDLLLSYLAQVRREFECSIVEGPPAGKSHEATMMAQYADGVILVLSAHRTRRVMARKIKEALEGARARILGTVLSDRVFPIPEGIYRRL